MKDIEIHSPAFSKLNILSLAGVTSKSQPPSKLFSDKFFESGHCACPILLLQCHSLSLSLHFDFEFQDFDLEIWNSDLDTGCDVGDAVDLKLGVEFPEKKQHCK